MILGVRPLGVVRSGKHCGPADDENAGDSALARCSITGLVATNHEVSLITILYNACRRIRWTRVLLLQEFANERVSLALAAVGAGARIRHGCMRALQSEAP